MRNLHSLFATVLRHVGIPLVGLLCLAAGSAQAALIIDSVTLDGGASVTVAPGGTITVAISETNTAGSNWRSTQFTTTPVGTTQCVDHANRDGNGAHSVTFTVTAPTTSGAYSANFVASSNDGCGGTLSSTFTLANAITVLPPAVVSITRSAYNPTFANRTVTWSVVFDRSVTGVDATDFSLVQAGGAAGASITSVTGSGTTWTVTANTGTSSAGTLQLRLVDDDSIRDSFNNPLGGTGTGNGNFNGETYTLMASICTSDPEILFCDDFERSNPGAVGNGWTVIPNNVTNCTGAAGNTGCAGIDADIPPFNNAASPRAFPTRGMFTRWSIVRVESPTVNLAGRTSGELSFTIRRGHDDFSECPEAAGENYLVEYYASDNTWKILAQFPSSPSAALCDGKIFLSVIELPDDAFHAGFKMRFYHPSSSGKSGSGGAPGVVGHDYWHMDDIIIRAKTAPSFVGPFCDNFEAGLGRWSISAEGAPSGAVIGDASIGTLTSLSPTRSLDLRWGYVVATTFKTDLRGVTGNISYWVRSGTNANHDPNAGEDLLLQYLNSSGNWITLRTFLGSAAAGTIFQESIPIPDDAKHQNFRLRYKKLNAAVNPSGYDYDYWHIDDVCVGDPLPVADLALTKTGDASLVPGGGAAYQLSVKNNGPGNLVGSLEIIDTLPNGITYLNASGSGWACSGNGQTVTCNWSGTLNSGATAPTLTLNVSIGGSVGGVVTNTATLSGTVVDTNTANNTATFSSGSFTPSYVLTNGPCVKGIAIGAPNQTCTELDWTDQVAGIPRTNIYITAVDGSGIPRELSASGATTVGLQSGLSCIAPGAHGNIQASFMGLNLPLCTSNGQLPSSWTTPSNVSFAANSPSVGPYSFNYNDVGRVGLHIRNSAATSQAGSSEFVVKPYAILMNLSCAEHFSPHPSAFCPAGVTVTATVTAVRFDSAQSNNLGAATPNFGKAPPTQMGSVVGSGFLQPRLVAPTLANGGSESAYEDLSWLDGNGNGLWENGEQLSFTWPEVGAIYPFNTLNYLGKGDLTAAGRQASEQFVGQKRFYPYRMELSDNGSAPGSSCQTYFGQPFRLGFSLTAQNKKGAAVKNYGLTGYAQRATGSALSIVADNGGTALGGNIRTFPGGAVPSFTLDWPNAAGSLATATVAAADFQYPKGAAPIAPLDSLQVGIQFVDDSGDQVPLTSGASLNLISTKMRYGRLRVANAFGSENLALKMDALLEYYNGARWVVNSIDNCTPLSALVGPTAALPVGTGATTPRCNVAGNTCSATSGAACNAGSAISGGSAGLCLTAPGAVGQVDVTFAPAAHLQHSSGVLTGRAGFGLYNQSGNARRIIHRREMR